MVRLFLGKLILSCLVLLLLFCYSCAPVEQPQTKTPPKPKIQQAKQPQVKPDTSKQKTQPKTEAPDEGKKIVAKIGEYTITAEELATNTMLVARPNPMNDQESYSRKNKPIDAETVLMQMLGDKAIIMRAREQNVRIKDKHILNMLDKSNKQSLVKLLFDTYLEEKMNIPESQIDKMLESTPELTDRSQARAILEDQMGNELISGLYQELYEELEVKEIGENITRAAQIYKRLLSDSKKYGGRRFVRLKQIEKDLTPEEKNLPLIGFEGGSVTLKYFFDVLTDMAPPSRPKDLDTHRGIYRFADAILKGPLFIAEAKRQGLDKDENLRILMRDREDFYLLRQVKRDKFKRIIKNPSEQEILQHINSSPKEHSEWSMLRIEQIWCQDLETAWKAKLELDNGSDFESVRQKYSFDKRTGEEDVYLGGQGMFYADLCKGQMGEIIGPVKGFYGDGVKWRIVKILEKEREGPIEEYTDALKGVIAEEILNDKIEKSIERYRAVMLQKYKFEIYRENIIDPLNPP